MQAPAQRSSAAPGPGLEEASHRPLILVVEDDAEMASLVETVLQDEGYEVCVRSSASDAFARVVDGEGGLGPRVDVVLTDLRLGRASGMELVTALQGISASASLLLMSGFVSTEMRDVAQLYGVRVLDKPFALDALRAAVDELVVSRDVRPPPRGEDSARPGVRSPAASPASSEAPALLLDRDGADRLGARPTLKSSS